MQDANTKNVPQDGLQDGKSGNSTPDEPLDSNNDDSRKISDRSSSCQSGTAHEDGSPTCNSNETRSPPCIADSSEDGGKKLPSRNNGNVNLTPAHLSTLFRGHLLDFL